MNFTYQPTFNSILMILIGLALIIFGGFLLLNSRTRFFSIGFFFTGVGNILFGLTHGFTDMTPVGHNFYRLAILAYCIGIPIVGFFIFRQMR